MSRKKAAKGKATNSSPSAGSPAGKGSGKTARSSSSIVQMNGEVHPIRPSISNSNEFYDIAFKNKVLTIDGVKVKLQIWDTAGQERFRSVTHAYYRDAHALLLLYDVTNKSSFDNIQAWLTEIHQYAQQDVVLMLLGNKADATHNRVVKREDGEKLAKEFGVPFMETSARSGLNVELAFTAVARSMKDPSEKFKLHEYVNMEMKGAGCCRTK
ncbi:ras-related protein Rab-26-like isoform X4 [Girardinichthys multiradiatus]|uniref:ras-related protein Rab-26-like isoform X4 n=1 Tax=Girardinichthys multiradiatus TaxID=208333 RepID=UPI001FABB294|nr:ras-related protein Rab-26-like isoform X4 [Girardinichthys multiradiatus]